MSAPEQKHLSAAEIAQAAASSGVSLSNNQIATLIASIAAMVQNQNLMLQQQQELAEAGPIRQIPAHKAKFRTPWNPDGNKRRVVLSRVCYLNGYRLREIMMSEREVELFNTIRPGKYNKNRWVVIEKPNSNEEDKSELHLYVPNKTEADRMRNKEDARNLTEILDKIVSEGKSVKLAS